MKHYFNELLRLPTNLSMSVYVLSVVQILIFSFPAAWQPRLIVSMFKGSLCCEKYGVSYCWLTKDGDVSPLACWFSGFSTLIHWPRESIQLPKSEKSECLMFITGSRSVIEVLKPEGRPQGQVRKKIDPTFIFLSIQSSFYFKYIPFFFIFHGGCRKPQLACSRW